MSTFTFLGLSDVVAPLTIEAWVLDAAIGTEKLGPTTTPDGLVTSTSYTLTDPVAEYPMRVHIRHIRKPAANGGYGSVTVNIKVTALLQRVDGDITVIKPCEAAVEFTMPGNVLMAGADAIKFISLAYSALIFGTADTEAPTAANYNKLAYAGTSILDS